ncbi:MAG: nucleotide exchange factor GrpE [Gammaproteobacteria bacterium]
MSKNSEASSVPDPALSQDEIEGQTGSSGAAEPTSGKETGSPAADSVSEMAAALAELRDQHLRTAAELENVRRRAARDVESAHRYGTERFARELLTVADSMEIGLQSIPQDQLDSPVAEGLQATLKQLEQCLAKFGIVAIEPLDEAFDPAEHEAIATQPAADQPPGKVLMVVQKGYRIHDRLLRPARVIVSREVDG